MPPIVRSGFAPVRGQSRTDHRRCILISRRSLAQFGLVVAMSRGVPTAATIATPGTEEAGDLLFQQDLPPLPRSRVDAVEVVESAIGDGQYAAIVVHNGTDETVGFADVTGTARDGEGEEIARSEVSVLGPYVLAAGAYGIGLVRFNEELRFDRRIDFDVRTDLPDNGFLPIVDLTITDFTTTEGNIAGTVTNTSPLVASPLVAVIGIFFDDGNKVCGWFRTYLSDYLDLSEEMTFEATRVFGRVTDSFAIAASGWAEF